MTQKGSGNAQSISFNQVQLPVGTSFSVGGFIIGFGNSGLLSGSCLVRESIHLSLLESEQIDAFATALMKKYTGAGQCTGTNNKLNQALTGAGIDVTPQRSATLSVSGASNSHRIW